MKQHKLLSIILAIATLLSANPSYAKELQDGQTSCENSRSSKKSRKMIYGSAAVGVVILALISLNFSKWCKHEDEPAQNEIKEKTRTQDKSTQNKAEKEIEIQDEPIQTETKKKIEKSVIPNKINAKKDTPVNKVSITPTERQKNWIKILSGEEITQESFRYKSGREFRQDTDEHLEEYHDFIQVFFPTYGESAYTNRDLNINSCRKLWERVATEEGQATITRIQREMRLNFIRMLLFWGFTVTLRITDLDDKSDRAYAPSDSKNLFSNYSSNCLEGHDFQLRDIALSANKPWSSNVNDHNRLRITRVLMALKIFGLDSEFDLFRRSLSALLRKNEIADKRSDSNGYCIGETGKYWNNTYKTKKLSDYFSNESND